MFFLRGFSVIYEYITGQVSDLTDYIDGLIDALTTHRDAIENSRFRVTRDAVQSIVKETLTKVQFNTVEYDGLSEYDNVTNYVFTASVAGYYHFEANVAISGITANELIQCWIVVNTDTYIAIDVKNSTITTTLDANPMCDIYLSQGDTVWVAIYHNYDPNKNTGTGYRCRFSGHRFA